jgi:hypothetical protein
MIASSLRAVVLSRARFLRTFPPSYTDFSLISRFLLDKLKTSGLRGEYFPLNLTVLPSIRTLLGNTQQGWNAPAVHIVGHVERATMWHASCAVSDAAFRHPLGLDHLARPLAAMLLVGSVRQQSAERYLPHAE